MPAARVLFVEDNVICQLETSDALRRHGFEVLEATSAAEALEIASASAPLAALLTDIDLGAGEDGYELARHVRETKPNLAVVYISDSAGARFPRERVEGAEFVAKPFYSDEVAATLDRLIDARAA